MPRPLLVFDDHPRTHEPVAAVRPPDARGDLTAPGAVAAAPPPQAIPATLAERFVARLIDSAILVGALAVLGCLSNAVEPGESGAGYLVALCTLTLLYGYEFFMTARYGQTLGKYTMKIKVITLSGETPSWTASAARAYVPAIANCLTCGLSGPLFYLSPLFDSGQWKRGWHDRLAATVVVQDERHARW